MLVGIKTICVPAMLAVLVVPAQKSALTVPLKFVPQGTSVDASGGIPSAVLDRPVAITVEDGRILPDAELIGEGTSDGFQIRANGPVVPFVNTTIVGLAGTRGLKVRADSTDRQLIIRLTRFWVIESHRTVGSTYAAEVQFAYLLKDAAGHILKDGTGSASANRYGRARSGDNCIEVLSDALRESTLTMFADAKLHGAWAGASASTPSAGTGDAGKKPVELKVGMTEAEVIAAVGQPQRRLTLVDRTLLQYPDLVVTIVSGKVTDIQIRRPNRRKAS